MICGDCPSEAIVSAAGPTARPSPSTSGTAPRLQPGNARLFRPAGARLSRAGVVGPGAARGRRTGLWLSPAASAFFPSAVLAGSLGRLSAFHTL